MVDIKTHVKKTSNKILSTSHQILANIEQQKNKKIKGGGNNVLA